MEQQNGAQQNASNAEARALTFGERQVGLNFNPSKRPEVDHVKRHHADLIDYMNNLRNENADPGVKRLASECITNLETACMYAVKALTWN